MLYTRIINLYRDQHNFTGFGLGWLIIYFWIRGDDGIRIYRFWVGLVSYLFSGFGETMEYEFTGFGLGWLIIYFLDSGRRNGEGRKLINVLHSTFFNLSIYMRIELSW